MAPLPFSWRVGRSGMIEGTIFQGSPFNSSGRCGGDQDHFEGTRPVYTLYSVELNIAGGARPADHGQWPGRPCSGDASRMSVPVSAMAAAHPVITPSTRSRSLTVRGFSGSSRIIWDVACANHASGTPTGSTTDAMP